MNTLNPQPRIGLKPVYKGPRRSVGNHTGDEKLLSGTFNGPKKALSSTSGIISNDSRRPSKTLKTFKIHVPIVVGLLECKLKILLILSYEK